MAFYVTFASSTTNTANSKGRETLGAEAPVKHRRLSGGLSLPWAVSEVPVRWSKSHFAVISEQEAHGGFSAPCGPSAAGRMDYQTEPASLQAASHVLPGGPILPPQAVSDRSLLPQNWLKVQAKKPGRDWPSSARSGRCPRPPRAAIPTPQSNCWTQPARTQPPRVPEQV